MTLLAKIDINDNKLKYLNSYLITKQIFPFFSSIQLEFSVNIKIQEIASLTFTDGIQDMCLCTVYSINVGI